MIVSTSEAKCVVCGGYIDPLEPGLDNPKHYHTACATQTKQLAVVWRGKVIRSSDEDLTWVLNKEEDEGLYLGAAFDDQRGFFTATIVLHGVESEGEGVNATEALDSAYIDLQQEVLRITAEAWQLGQGA